MRLICLMLVAASSVAACSFRGLRSPPLSDEQSFTKQGGTTWNEVVNDLKECGRYKWREMGSADERINFDPKWEECMFLKGYYFKSGFGGTCSIPYYREKASFCDSVPLRSQHGYYGH